MTEEVGSILQLNIWELLYVIIITKPIVVVVIQLQLSRVVCIFCLRLLHFRLDFILKLLFHFLQKI